MKTHVRNTAVGGVMLPIALMLAALIANEGQTLIGLELDRVSLAIFLLPFLYGCAEVVKALLHHEAAKIGQDLFGALGIPAPGEGPQAGEQVAPIPVPVAPMPTAGNAPPPPTPPASS